MCLGNAAEGEGIPVCFSCCQALVGVGESQEVPVNYDNMSPPVLLKRQISANILAQAAYSITLTGEQAAAAHGR